MDANGSGSPPNEGSMTSSRPYLLRAVYDWINDNGLTPQVIVDTSVEGVQVPGEYVHDNRIVLNISPSAVRNLNLGNDWVTFGARFGGRPMEVFVPTHAVLAVMARETGAGMPFPEEAPPSGGSEAGGAPLTVDQTAEKTAGPALSAVTSTVSSEADDASGDGQGEADSQTPRPSGGPPTLRVVK